MKYKMDEKVCSDLQAVKDIAVDDGDLKIDSMVAVDTLRNRATTEVHEDGRGDFKEMEAKAIGETNTTKILQSMLPQLKLSVDVGRPEKVVPTIPRSTKPVGADSTVVKEKIKQPEAHGTNGKQARPNTVPRWVPPNTTPFVNSMHVAHPLSKYNSAPPILAFCASPKDSNGDAHVRISPDTAAAGDLASYELSSPPVVSPHLGPTKVVPPCTTTLPLPPPPF